MPTSGDQANKEEREQLLYHANSDDEDSKLLLFTSVAILLAQCAVWIAMGFAPITLLAIGVAYAGAIIEYWICWRAIRCREYGCASIASCCVACIVAAYGYFAVQTILQISTHWAYTRDDCIVTMPWGSVARCCDAVFAFEQALFTNIVTLLLSALLTARRIAVWRKLTRLQLLECEQRTSVEPVICQ